MKRPSKESSLQYALIISTVLHLFAVSPVDQYFHSLYHPDLPEEAENTRIEFEFFQAAPRAASEVFIPRGIDPDTSLIQESVKDKPEDESDVVNIPIEKTEVPEEGLLWEDDSYEELDLIPSLEERTAIHEREEQTTESLETEIELEELETTETIKWDYCNRIRTLIESHASLPDAFAKQGIADIVKVEITLDRHGKLINGTPKILREESSRYEEVNQAALTAIHKAAYFFPPIPKRFPKDKITFWLPIRFTSKKE